MRLQKRYIAVISSSGALKADGRQCVLDDAASGSTEVKTHRIQKDKVTSSLREGYSMLGQVP